MGISGVIVIIIVFNNQNSEKPYRPPSSASSSSVGSAPAYTPVEKRPSSPAVRSEPKITFQRPPVGRDNVLSVAQIRWCLREGILVDVKRPLISSNLDVAAFNESVDDHNRRCGSFKYRRGVLERAKREVEAMRTQIVAEGTVGFGQPRGTIQTPSNRNGDPAAVLEAQRFLTNLGYDPGMIDGIFGRKTKSAIKQFERNAGKRAIGDVTDELLLSLRLRAM